MDEKGTARLRRTFLGFSFQKQCILCKRNFRIVEKILEITPLWKTEHIQTVNKLCDVEVITLLLYEYDGNSIVFILPGCTPQAHFGSILNGNDVQALIKKMESLDVIFSDIVNLG